MASPRRFKPRFKALALGVSLALASGLSATQAAESTDTFSMLRQGTDLQQCLSHGSTSVSFETQLTADGALREATRVTHLSLENDSARLVECTQGHHRCLSTNLVFPVSIHTREIDNHASWDASDRMRLTDVIVDSLSEEAEGSGNFVAIKNEDESAYHLALTGMTSQTPDLVLDTTLRYSGALMSTEGLNTWFAPSHQALVEMRLVDRRTNKTFATRAIKISIPVTLRSRDTSGGTNRQWLEMVRAQVKQTGMSMLEEFRCAPQIMTAQSISDTKVIVHVRGVQGLLQGQGMLLIPRSQLTEQDNLQRKPGGWPIVRLSQVDELRAQADVISGSIAACRSGDCVAIPL